MKFLCTRCGIISEEVDEKPKECSICKAEQTDLELVTGENVPETEPIPKEEKEASDDSALLERIRQIASQSAA